MEKRIVVTIGRQFGSGGRIVGKKLAEQLGIPYYDKELIWHPRKVVFAGSFLRRLTKKIPVVCLKLWLWAFL